MRSGTSYHWAALAALGVVRLRHPPVVQSLVEHVIGNPALAGDLTQGAPRCSSLLDDLGGGVVADIGVQSGGGRERQLCVALARLAIGLDPVDALPGQQPGGEASSLIESNRFRASIGTNTFSSKCPCIPPTVMAASFPIT